MKQEEKIDKFLTSNDFDRYVTRTYVKSNIAKTKETSDVEGTPRNMQIAGTSGKAPPAYTIAQNAFAEFPSSVVNFEIYDNKTSNIAEIEGAILKASSGESFDGDVEEEVGKSEEQILAGLKRILGQSDNASIKKFQLIETEKGYQLRDISGEHITKSKGDKAPKTEAGPYLLKYQKIQKKFFALIKLLKSGGRAGAPSQAITVPLDIVFTKQLPDSVASNPELTTKVQEAIANYTLPEDVHVMYTNYIPGLGTTGLEPVYSNKDKINDLKKSMEIFISSYDKMKSAFEEIKGLISASKPAKAPKKPKAATSATQTSTDLAREKERLRAMGDLDAADDLDADDDFDAAAAADSYSDDQMYADMADAEEQDRAAKAARKAKKPIKESFTPIRLIFKTRK